MNNLEKKSRFYKALSETIRLSIIKHLIDKEECLCICELSKLLKKDQSVIFRHIQILKDVGIIDTCKENKFLMCCIKNKGRIREFLED
ncbi:winged helix-turn-helix transcriptional regulator [Candidatus Woesearchaeota archaeon]|nr:winged helix-turn-helix transcriptional regulator [Candidatus Woesearchaeota archaeon]